MRDIVHRLIIVHLFINSCSPVMGNQQATTTTQTSGQTSGGFPHRSSTEQNRPLLRQSPPPRSVRHIVTDSNVNVDSPAHSTNVGGGGIETPPPPAAHTQTSDVEWTQPASVEVDGGQAAPAFAFASAAAAGGDANRFAAHHRTATTPTTSKSNIGAINGTEQQHHVSPTALTQRQDGANFARAPAPAVESDAAAKSAEAAAHFDVDSDDVDGMETPGTEVIYPWPTSSAVQIRPPQAAAAAAEPPPQLPPLLPASTTSTSTTVLVNKTNSVQQKRKQLKQQQQQQQPQTPFDRIGSDDSDDSSSDDIDPGHHDRHRHHLLQRNSYSANSTGSSTDSRRDGDARRMEERRSTPVNAQATKPTLIAGAGALQQSSKQPKQQPQQHDHHHYHKSTATATATADQSQRKRLRTDAPMLNHIFDGVASMSKHHHYHDSRYGPHFEDIYSDGNVTNITVQVGSTVYLNCRISLLQDKTVSWVRRKTGDANLDLLTVGKHTYSGDPRYRSEFQYPDNWRLRLEAAVKADEGTYECQISTHPPRIIQRNVFVNDPKVLIIDETGQPLQDKYYEVDSTMQLSCIVRHVAMKTSTVLWSHGEQVLNYDTQRGGVSVKTEIMEKGANSTLFIAKINKSDSGNYTCSINSSHDFTVLVHVLNGESFAELHHGGGGGSSSASKSSIRADCPETVLVLMMLWSCLLLVRHFATVAAAAEADPRQQPASGAHCHRLMTVERQQRLRLQRRQGRRNGFAAR